ncbi:MAG: alpha-L-rhamnosidase C-terminal domain-containing protein [Eisenbergiella sp.]
MGATTVWERWNSVRRGKISDTGMNSLNHYAYGAVSEWIYRSVCGIAPDESTAGFKKAVLAPCPDERFQWVKGEYASASGLYRSGWEFEGEHILYEAEIPFDCTAEFLVPEGMAVKSVNGTPAEERERLPLKKGVYRLILEKV